MNRSKYKNLLGNPVAFYPSLIKISKSVTAGLFLSQLFYWSDKGADPDDWIYKTRNEWQAETYLSRDEQETARAKLRQLKLIEERKNGVPCRLFYRINWVVFDESLEALLPHSWRETPQLGGGAVTLGAPQLGGIPPTRRRESRQLEGGNPANNLYTEITTEITTESKQYPRAYIAKDKETDRFLEPSAGHVHSDVPDGTFSVCQPEPCLSCRVDELALACEEKNSFGFQIPTAEEQPINPAEPPSAKDGTAEETNQFLLPVKEKRIESDSAESISDPKRPSPTVSAAETKNCKTDEASEMDRIEELVNRHKPEGETEEETANLVAEVARIEAELRSNAATIKASVEASTGMSLDVPRDSEGNYVGFGPETGRSGRVNRLKRERWHKDFKEARRASEEPSLADQEERVKVLIARQALRYRNLAPEGFTEEELEGGWKGREPVYDTYLPPLDAELERGALETLLGGLKEQVSSAIPIDFKKRLWEYYNQLRPMGWTEPLTLEANAGMGSALASFWVQLRDPRLTVAQNAIAIETKVRDALCYLISDNFYWRKDGHKAKNFGWFFRKGSDGVMNVDALSLRWLELNENERAKAMERIKILTYKAVLMPNAVQN